MALERYAPVQPQDAKGGPSHREFVDSQQRLTRTINQYASKEPLDGRLIEDIELEPFTDNVINHGLGRKLRGRMIALAPSQPSSFRAIRSGTQAITTGVTTKVQFDSETYDLGSNYDPTTNYRFTAPVDGLYQFSCSVYMAALADQARHVVIIQKNGADLIESNETMSGNHEPMTMAHTGPVRLDADDYIECHVLHTHGADRNVLTGAAYTWFGGGIIDEGVTDGQDSLSDDEQTKLLVLRCSYARTVSVWVF
jgi:hypothetical protein